MNIIAFAASNSSASINKQLASHALRLLTEEISPDAGGDLLDLNDFEMPIYSEDREKADGIPEQAVTFRRKVAEADAVIIAFAEHNGSYSAAYKNIFDWASRLEGKVYQDKPVLLLSTSPGGRGAKSVLDQATAAMPHFGATVVGALSVPSFHDHFDKSEDRLTDEALSTELRALLSQLAEQG